MSESPPTAVWPIPVSGGPESWPVIPGYEITEELGRGGMGVVYKAKQAGSERWVALKLMRDVALAGPKDRARFRFEAEAIARTRHPNVVQIYDVSESAGRPFFTMELVEGGSLDQHLGQPQPARESAKLLLTLARAIHHAHAQHVVHRDLKPANILLHFDGQEIGNVSGREDFSFPALLRSPSFVPKITDFGLAKRLDSDSTAWTQEGAVLGTPCYMAPEQAAGRIDEIGAAVDVYAFGAILYELLTGRPPFRADTLHHTIEQVLRDEPVPPTRRQANIPVDLETIVLQCLEKEPARRYPSAKALADDLERFLDSQTVSAVPVSERERLTRLARRDGYEIVNEIGHGPRSTVFHAHFGPLKQPVALKVFQRGACSREEWEGRLKRGAELWATLSHPHLVPFHRGGVWDGSPYLAMEWVPQGSLASKLAGKPFPLRSALSLVEELGQIVLYLHRQGVVHGNLKPSNVLLAADGIPRIVDFRVTGCSFLDLTSLAEGKPDDLAYVAPELVRDPATEPRPHTDIYGLGMILYVLLTGQQPFTASSAAETLEDVNSRSPVPPSQLNSEVTPHLQAFCLRCLRKNPWRRFYRTFDVLMGLRHFLDDQDGSALAGIR